MDRSPPSGVSTTASMSTRNRSNACAFSASARSGCSPSNAKTGERSAVAPPPSSGRYPWNAGRRWPQTICDRYSALALPPRSTSTRAGGVLCTHWRHLPRDTRGSAGRSRTGQLADDQAGAAHAAHGCRQRGATRFCALLHDATKSPTTLTEQWRPQGSCAQLLTLDQAR